MFDIHAVFATDESLENNGAWFPLGPKPKEGSQPRLLVARGNNRKFNKLVSTLVDQHQAVLALEDDAAEAMQEQITIDAMASAILLGWEHCGFKGEEKAYSVAAAKEMLAVKDFRKAVARMSDSFDAYKVKEEAVQGNV